MLSQSHLLFTDNAIAEASQTLLKEINVILFKQTVYFRYNDVKHKLR